MPIKLRQSPRYKLGLRDLVRGFVMAVLTSALTGVYKLIEAMEPGQSFTAQDARTIGLVALAAGFAYLVKNFVTAPDKPRRSKP